MDTSAHQRLWLVTQRRARDHRQAARARHAERAGRRHRPSLRLRAGHALIALGRRLAVEPTLNRARST